MAKYYFQDLQQTITEISGIWGNIASISGDATTQVNLLIDIKNELANISSSLGTIQTSVLGIESYCGLFDTYMQAMVASLASIDSKL
ncbi:MAG: hypothetical protein [Arizlama microvirus]|nr:MAG: hypothetical protein [Arizlama microvirus]